VLPEQRDAVLSAFREEKFAVFAFAGGAGEPPYSTVMFFAERPDLSLVFATSPGPSKRPFARPGNGACAQIDNRAVGIDAFARFTRVTVQGYLERSESPAERDALHSLYAAKLPFAKVFLERPGVETFVLRPCRIVYARGFAERFELELPAAF
jgi:nitroimidazol reductase NimA-like FMN-containing flavoprotein (pyridoxamine 5'-phosphate oxidase superfamily)